MALSLSEIPQIAHRGPPRKLITLPTALGDTFITSCEGTGSRPAHESVFNPPEKRLADFVERLFSSLRNRFEPVTRLLYFQVLNYSETPARYIYICLHIRFRVFLNCEFFDRATIDNRYT